MTPRNSITRTFVLTVWLMLGACSGPAVRSAAPFAFVPVERQYLPLPENVRPVMPTFAPDGRDILFLNQFNNSAWIIREDGSDLHCIDCEFPERPKSRLFLYAFSDGMRLMMARGVGPKGGGTTGADADAWVLECAPSLRRCESHRFVDVDMSADRGRSQILHRRFWHLAPDETHLGWMNVREDGTAIIVARLERQADRYVAADPRAINPPGPMDPDDDRADRWEYFSQLYELKGFTPDGKSVLAVGLPGNNIDLMQIDLASGRVARLTARPDWDEDASLSPDQTLLVVNSWRGRHRLNAFSWIPQIRGFTGLMFGAALAPYYVSTWAGFQCNLSPWLLPASGDDAGRIVGQPLDTYDNDLTAADNVVGRYVWSRDSTKVLLQEKTRDPPPATQIPNRIAIARIARKPGTPVSVSASKVGSWAPAAAQYEGPHATERSIRARGQHGGTVTIRYSGSLGSNASTSVTYERFTDDGRTFVDGSMKASSQTGRWFLTSNVTVSGEHTGSLKMDLTFDNKASPLPLKQGTISAVYDGKVAPPIPEVGPCYDVLPKVSPLRLVVVRDHDRITATVTAEIDGDAWPVEGATISAGMVKVITDATGIATLPIPAGKGDIAATATAGDTFSAATVLVPSEVRPASKD